MRTILIEELVRETGHTYRTVKKRLDDAGVVPIGKDGQRILYPEGPARRAVMLTEPAVASQVSADEDFVAGFLTPAIFSASSPLTKLLLGNLRESGMSKADALRVWQLVLTGYIEAVNEFFMHGDGWDDGKGLALTLPDLAQSIAKHGTGPEAVAAFLDAGGWADAPPACPPVMPLA